jgi:hypothetical protein
MSDTRNERNAAPAPRQPEPPSSPIVGSLARRRRRVVVSGVGLLILVGGVSWWAARATTSVGTVAHRSAPPARPTLVAHVVLRRLGVELFARGRLISGGSERVSIGQIAVPDALPIVTSGSVRSGARVGDGSVIAQVAGRPVILLQGTTPMYRTIVGGDSGADVAQIQADLRGLGFAISDATGVYGPSTSSAIRELYVRDGYAPPMTEPGFRTVTAGGKRVALALVAIPQAEVVFVPTLPAVVGTTSEAVGQAIHNPAATLIFGRPVVEARLSEAQAYQVQPGEQAKLTLGDGRQWRGKVVTVDRSIRADRGAAEITVPGDVPGSVIGQTATIEIDTQALARPVLAVPVAALYADGNGNTYVITDAARRERRIFVAARTAIGGYVPIAKARGIGPGTAVVLNIG